MLLTRLHQAFFCDDETRSLFELAVGEALLEYWAHYLSQA